MLEFKPVQLSDKPGIDNAMWAEDSRSADFNFANIYMWDNTFKQAIAYCGERTVVKPRYAEEPFFVFPVGSGDLKSVVDTLKTCADESGMPLRFRGVTQENIERLDAVYPGSFSYSEDRAFFDYIYSAEKLSTLAGKKLHSKRNHINRFIENNDWSFEPLTAALIPECKEMLAVWESEMTDTPDPSLQNEHTAIYRAFEHFEYLGLEGGVLRSSVRIIGFTIGEKISSDTYNIHFEKAYSEIQGAYPMINREFVRLVLELHPEIVYINREDDMGKENLRKAKLSYYPDFLVEKYTATWED